MLYAISYTLYAIRYALYAIRYTLYAICLSFGTPFQPNLMLGGACTLKHYRFVIYRFCSKLVHLSKLVYLWLTLEKTLACYEIYPFFVNYESVKVYSTGPRSLPERGSARVVTQKTFNIIDSRHWVRGIFRRIDTLVFFLEIGGWF